MDKARFMPFLPFKILKTKKSNIKKQGKRNSRLEMFCRKGALKNLQNSLQKTCAGFSF